MTLPKATSKPMEQGRIDPSSPLAGCVENMYKHINFPAPSHLGVCDCCVSLKTTKSILSKEQKDLTREEIWEWYQGAVIDDFPQEVWGFLLPRIFEILACGLDVYGIGIETALDRFETGNADKWTEQQWDAISAFQKTLLENHGIFKNESPLDILCMFTRAGWNLDDMTDQILGWPDNELIHFFWVNGVADDYGISGEGAFWPKGVSMRAFLKAESFLSRLEAVVMDNEYSSDIQLKASKVYEAAKAF